MGARSVGTTAHAGGRGRGRVRAAFCLCAALAVGATATAQAQEDPYATVEEQANTSDLDTDLTPVAKETDLWTLLHGANYPETEVIEGSATTFSTELHAVSFRNTTIGLAGGSACAIEPVQQAKEDAEPFGERVAACEGLDGQSVPRVPALYRYSEPADADPLWERLPLPNEEDHAPGYIASIAWIDADRALIVGGTGTYPRREAPADGKAPTDPTKADEAGKARAWIYRRSTGKTEELDLSALTPDTPATGETPARAGMRGLTAVACYVDPNPQPGEKKLELCFAGALGQLWEWRDADLDGEGAFNGKRVDAASPEADLKDASLFRYRVRDIVFTAEEPPIARAVTSGCCAPDPSENTPRVIRYDAATPACDADGRNCSVRHGPPRWFAEDFFGRLSINPGNLPESVTIPKQFPQANPPLKDFPCALGVSCTVEIPGGGEPILPPGTETRRREINDRPQWPDSIYSMTARGSGILSSGDPAPADDPASVITKPGSDNVSPVGPELFAPRVSVSTARLLDGDGDIARADPNRPSGFGSNAAPEGDGEPDWVVGELRSTSRGALGARGLLAATALAPTAEDSINVDASTGAFGLGVNCGSSCFTPGVRRPASEEAVSGWQPIDQEKFDTHRRSLHYLLPSYTANAIEIVGAEEDGWMVGEHGAILRLSTEQLQSSQGATEPKPPRLGGARSKPLSDRSPYEDASPELPASAGPIPAFGAERTQLPKPETTNVGSVGPVEQIIMSRDGSEGWAIGNAGGPTFAHYDGVAWSPCDSVGVPGSVAPDPACAAMGPLRGWRAPNGDLRTTQLTAAARVPLENDADPTNDDELEIVAVGTNYQGRETEGKELPTLVRYREGHWRFEDPAALGALIPQSGSSRNVRQLAFTAPDDGWTFDGTQVFHFDGEHWIACRDAAGLCGDPDGRITGFDSSGAVGDAINGLAQAGERIYLYGRRTVGAKVPVIGCIPFIGASACATRSVPMIVYRDDGGEWTDGSGDGEDSGGLDPGFADPASTAAGGRVESLAVVKRADGGFEGWAVGEFGGIESGVETIGTPSHAAQPDAALLRLDPDGEGWRAQGSPGAFADYMLPGPLRTRTSLRSGSGTSGKLMVAYDSETDPDGVFIGTNLGRVFGYDSARERFGLIDSARPQGGTPLYLRDTARPAGNLTAMAPDGQGGFWAAASGHIFRYADEAPEPVFAETASPLGAGGAELTALDAGSEGELWAATSSDRLYRYQRGLGWEEARIPGWDPGRIVTRASAANAIAIGANGEGLVVGEGGRIAAFDSESVSLDPAAGRSCAHLDDPPCGTGRDLLAVDVAPDGAAIAAGEALSLLWRPPGGAFQAIERPRVASSTAVVSVSYPTPTRAYLATDAGLVFRGEMTSSGQWSWRTDNADHRGEVTTLDAQGRRLAIHDLAIDASGYGYAVGEGIFQRTEGAGWQRLPTRYGAGTAVELSPDGKGVLIGGEGGRILAGSGSELHVARPDDFHDNRAVTGPVVGLAYLPGSSAGTVDAWAATAPAGEGDSRLFRHRTEPADPALDPAAAIAPLPDTPPPSGAELSLAAFGKSDCDHSEAELCPELSATTTTNEVVSERIVDELAERREASELDLALLSGDAVDSAGLPGSSAGDLDRVGAIQGVAAHYSRTGFAGQLKHRRYAELVTDELSDEGVPLLGAIGSQDLSETYACNPDHGCDTTKRFANAGENLAWREAFAGRAEPWGDGSGAPNSETGGELSFEPAPGSEENSLRIEDQRADADGEGLAPEAKAEIGGASTHYAVDAVRDGDEIARIVFVDTSLRSLAASDPLQQPHELAGGQLRFLERMICREGETTTAAIDECTRGPDQRAIVVSNTPTYSYGPGALTHTALDGTTFEATMLRYDVDLVISGALGYNGLYYTLAPGVHEPCPAGQYPEAPPSGNTPDCLAGPTGPADAVTKQAPADPASLISEQGLSGAYPTLIASGAGGKLGPDGTAAPDGPAGQWHGYSIARLLLDGDLVVEQRPILDWIGMDAPDHAIAPRARLRLNGYGRSPVSTTVEGEGSRAFHYEISTPAITHRYDLLLADPDEPWLPCSEEDINCQELHANLTNPNADTEPTPTPTGKDNPCSPYLCLPPRIGVVDDQSGQVRAGDGKYPETFAIAMLSVDEEVATYPLVFKRSPAFVTSPSVRTGTLPKLSGARPGLPPPPPPPPGLPQIPQVDVPQIPPPPGIPQLTAATPPELQPPAPPAPPPPSQQPAPLDLSVAPPGVSISTPTALIQPPTPPVNPAPPGGGRREARQRQAAAQKGGADSDSASEEGANESSDGDLANNRPGVHGASRIEAPADASRHAFSQRSRSRPEPSFTALSRPTHASDGPGPLPITAGLTIAALALALGFTTLRPGPRRREPEVPAPAYRRWR